MRTILNIKKRVKGLGKEILVTDNAKKVWERLRKEKLDVIAGAINEE